MRLIMGAFDRCRCLITEPILTNLTIIACCSIFTASIPEKIVCQLLTKLRIILRITLHHAFLLILDLISIVFYFWILRGCQKRRTIAFLNAVLAIILPKGLY